VLHGGVLPLEPSEAMEGGGASCGNGGWEQRQPLSEGGGRRCPKVLGTAWAPLFRLGHRPVGPARFFIFPIYPKPTEL
jgi:hypothetical protein